MNAVVETLRTRFETRETLSVPFRRNQLETLDLAIERFEPRLLDALGADLGKPTKEAYLSEIAFVRSDIRHALKHLNRWTRPQSRRAPWMAWPSSARVRSEPYGIALIIGPWNYPFQLLFTPLVGAIAAGNCVCLKPSELAPRTSAIIVEMIRETFPADLITVVEGAGETVQSLIHQEFDTLFFTGSTRTGRAVMEAAARRLTPVTLELGGKNPCIVCRDAKIQQAARRIAWGKFLNAGQTCVAPDHVWVDAAVRDELLDALKTSIETFYGPSPEKSPDYGRIVNAAHFERLAGYLGQGAVFHGGEIDEAERYIAPSLLTDVNTEAPIMQEEIFGPLLPVLAFEDCQEVVERLTRLPAPLALYLFTRDRALEGRILAQTRSGNVCVNDTVSQILGKDLPFGGVGESGMGAYHGKTGFDAFSHYRSILRRSTRLDTPFRYPPVKVSLEFLKRVAPFLLRR